MIFSAFTGCFDSKPVMIETDWPIFIEYLRGQTLVAADRAQKTSTALISPAIYPEGAKRSKASVTGWNWFAADIDNKEGNAPGASIIDVAERFLGSHPFAIYSTSSNRDGHDCFRLIFPLTRQVSAEEFPRVWHAVNEWLGGIIDAATKDISRIFIEPRAWEGSLNVFFDNPEGEPVSPDELVERFPMPLPIEPVRPTISLSLSREYVEDADSLDGPYVTEKMLKAYEEGSTGRMFPFLCAVATRASLKGYDLTQGELARIGRELARRSFRHEDDIEHDARNALSRGKARAAELASDQFAKTFERKW